MTEIDKLRDCPVLVTIEAIGGKWRTRILWHLRAGPCRFGELQRAIGASTKVLAQNLKALEKAGLIIRTETREGNSLMTEYAFTPYCGSLAPVLDAMGAWGVTHKVRAKVEAAPGSQQDSVTCPGLGTKKT